MCQKKHAYLIIAHNEFDILKFTLEILDDSLSDMYVHVDKKVSNFNPVDIKSCVHDSKIYFIKRKDIQWGSDSQIKCELALLRAAVKGNYEYYHLISGVDMPLKTPLEIYDFFEKNTGKNYLSFSDDVDKNNVIEYRIKYFRLFQQKIGRNSGFKIAIYEKMNEYILNVQKKLKVDRMKSYKGGFYKGGNWFSITHELAMKVLKEKKIVKKYFYHSLCADEIFLQTIAMNSAYKHSVVKSDMRYIDWERGRPYTFQKEDFNELINSEYIFARKFNSKVDLDIINKIYRWLKEKKEECL